MVMLRSSSFLNLTVWTPEMAFTTVDLPCATCPMVPEAAQAVPRAPQSGHNCGSLLERRGWVCIAKGAFMAAPGWADDDHSTLACCPGQGHVARLTIQRSPETSRREPSGEESGGMSRRGWSAGRTGGTRTYVDCGLSADHIGRQRCQLFDLQCCQVLHTIRCSRPWC